MSNSYESFIQNSDYPSALNILKNGKLSKFSIMKMKLFLEIKTFGIKLHLIKAKVLVVILKYLLIPLFLDFLFDSYAKVYIGHIYHKNVQKATRY